MRFNSPLFTLVFVLAYTTAQAQVVINKGTIITISSGATLTVNGTLQNEAVGFSRAGLQNAGTLQVGGDFINDATALYSGTGLLELTGPAAQLFSGANFYDLKVSGLGTKTISGNSSIQNSLVFAPSVTAELNTITNQDTLVLGSAATLTETATGFITGWLRTDRTLAQATVYYFGGIGLTMEAKGAAPGLTTVIRGTGGAANLLGTGNAGIGRTFIISPANNAALNAYLSFTYKDSELNDLSEEELMGYITQDEGETWSPIRYDSRDVSTNTFTFSGVNSLSGVSAGAPTTPLPVTWLYFTGLSDAGTNILNWATASEKDSESFLVERSTDGRQFSQVGSVKAAGNSHQKITYTYTDQSSGVSASTLTYYRLKQTDTDGKFEYSKVIAVNHKAVPFESITFPNPFTDELTILLRGGTSEPVTFTLTALDGRLVYRRSFPENQANNSILLKDLPPLASGIYMLRTQQAGWVNLQKIIRR